MLCVSIWQIQLLYHSPLGDYGGLRSPASAWLVLWPAPAHACNAVCNEKSKQGTAVRHDRNVFPLERAREKKERREETLRRSCVQKECSLRPKRKTNVIVHCLSFRQTLPLQLVDGLPTSFSTASLSLCFPETLFAQVDSDTVLNEPQSFPPFLHALAVDCVIESECGGACRELEGEASTRVHSGWEGRRKSRDKHWEEQN